MTNPNNVEQFNAQVKRMSERLRGDSASPADTQANEEVGEDGSNPQGAGGHSVGTTASTLHHPQVRKKGTGGRRGLTTSRQSAAGTAPSDEAEAAHTQATPDEDTTTGNGIELAPAVGATSAPTATQAEATEELSASPPSAGNPDATQPLTQASQGNNVPANQIGAHTAGETEEATRSFIAPEIIGRALSGGGNCKP